MWPFKKSAPEPLTPVELREQLIEAAASGSGRKLRSLCEQYKAQVAEHVDVICKIPNGMPTDDGSIDRYVQCLGAVAQCLAQKCSSPELWDRLAGDPDDNPLVQWDRWFGELPQRMEQLEYEVLIDEARAFIEKAKTLRGGTARQHEAFLVGRLGELHFHSGRVSEAVQEFQLAFDLCVENSDVEGQLTYLNNLLEVHCHLDDGLALQVAEQLFELRKKSGVPTDDIQNRIERLTQGEPLCRVIFVNEGRELELDEITTVGEGSYQFQFRRNRLSLQKATTLTEQGNQLASSGQLSDALEKYYEASEIDPHDPDPVYQSGMCLLELGVYGKAREAFEEVEQLAPGWFRCRTGRWFAKGLEDGTISDEEFHVVRVLEDGGLDAPQASSIAEQAIERYPDFAPLRLIFGDLCGNRGDEAGAIAAYRKGLELVEEPDLESRLLCALAGRMPNDSPERKQLVERAVNLDGNLVALATAKLIGLH